MKNSCNSLIMRVAVEEGFEPPIPFRVYFFSKEALSAAQPLHRKTETLRRKFRTGSMTQRGESSTAIPLMM